MVVTSGRSNRHVGVGRRPRASKTCTRPACATLRVEGMPHCDWVLIDAGDVIVHVFRPEVRAFYNLEKMWAPARRARGRAERLTARRPGAAEPLRVPMQHASRMRLVIAAVGRLKRGPGARARRALSQARRADRPRHRAARPRSRRNPREPRRSDAAAAHARGIDRDRQRHPGRRRRPCILDERGESLDSASFAERLRGWRDDGRPAAVLHHRRRRRPRAEPARQGQPARSPSAPPPGRTSSCASCCWSRSTARSRILSGHPYHRA